MIAGCGKTFLAVGAIDYLFTKRGNTKTSISYFFCDFRNQQSREVRTILGGLVRQILTVFHQIPPEMEIELEAMFFRNHHRKPGNEELFQLLVSVVQLSATAYIVIDGIDECKDDDRRQLLLYLNKLIRISKSKVKIFVSSRPEVDISKSLGNFHPIVLDPSTTRSDIEVFIHDVIDQKLQPGGGLVINHSSMAGEIKLALIDGSNGMYVVSAPTRALDNLLTGEKKVSLGHLSNPRDLQRKQR